MEELEVLLLMAIAAMGILLIVLLHKITILKKQTDDIVREVKTYVTYITEESEADTEPNASISDYNVLSKRFGQASVQAAGVGGQANKEELESNIIQAVLGEYFP